MVEPGPFVYECSECSLIYESPTKLVYASHSCGFRQHGVLQLVSTAHPRGVEGDAHSKAGRSATGQ